MEEHKKKIFAALILIVPVIVIIVVAILVRQWMPSKEVLPLTEYYPVEKGELLLIMQDEIYETKGLLIDNVAYIDYDTVVSHFNKRFYWDANENLLVYTTASQVIKAEVGAKAYFINKSKEATPYQIVKVVDDKAYIAIDYVKKFSNLEAVMYTEPNRVVLTYKWNQSYDSTVVKKKTKLRLEASHKSPIVYDLAEGDTLVLLKEGEEASEKYLKVITNDGVIGYAEKKKLKDITNQVLKTDYEEEKYPAISKDYKINLVWHQVTNKDANDSLLNLLDATKGVNTISPTWFSLANNKGEITSLASEKYVERAHNAGVEVWALCDDFDKENVDVYELFSHTSSREKLANELIATAIKYNLDGINIDFENITKAAAPHFVQFIREFSVKCRSNGVVLSVDNYAPGYTDYYDREEQGIVADYVITMAYDEHTGGSDVSGSVASIGYVQDAIANTLKEVPAEKTIIGIPFYTRLWKEVMEDEKLTITSEAYSMTRGANVLRDHNITPYWEKNAGQYYGEFEADGALYRMWLEEEESIELKMKAIDEASVAGVAGWKLGLEKAEVWNVILKYVN